MTNHLQLSADNARNSAHAQLTTVTPLDTADLTVSALVTPTLVMADAPLTYTLTITNLGLGVAQNVSVVHRLTGDATAIDCQVAAGALCQSAGQVVTATYSTLAGLAAQQITMTLAAPDQPGSFTSTTQVNADNDLNPNNNRAMLTTTLQTSAEVALAALKAPAVAAVNAPLTYTVTITNSGPHLALVVRVTTNLPPTVTLTA